MVQRGGSRWTATSASDGSFCVPQLPEGEYDVSFVQDSLPDGYAAGDLMPKRVQVGGASYPGIVTFAVRAIRGISGRVLTYDADADSYVPVAGVRVSLDGLLQNSITDTQGRYLFRHLLPGSYKISVTSGKREFTATAQLGPGPWVVGDVDLRTAEGPQRLPAATAQNESNRLEITLRPPIIRPQPSETDAVAEKHHVNGRQLTKARRYAEAIAELTTSIHLRPAFAPAYNGRGYAWFMLHNYARAIDDLNTAIRLNPSYADAYHIRGVAGKAAGELAQAEADLKKAKQLGDRQGLTLPALPGLR